MELLQLQKNYPGPPVTPGVSSVPQRTFLFHKGMFCPTRDFFLRQGTGLSHKGLLYPKRNFSVPQGTSLAHNGLLGLTKDLLSHKELSCLTRDCSVPEGTSLSYIRLFCPSEDSSMVGVGLWI